VVVAVSFNSPRPSAVSVTSVEVVRVAVSVRVEVAVEVGRVSVVGADVLVVVGVSVVVVVDVGVDVVVGVDPVVAVADSDVPSSEPVCEVSAATTASPCTVRV
jgi:hypothetical protein